MNKSEFHKRLYKVDWTTKCDIAPIDPKKYLKEYSTPNMNEI